MKIKKIAAISTLNKLKLLLLLPVIASAIVPSYSTFSAPAPVDNVEIAPTAPVDNIEIAPTDTEDTEGTAAKRRPCEARFTANGQITAWIGLGDVGGFLANKKKECLQKAKNYVPTLKFSDFGLTGQQVCDLGGEVNVYIDTRIEGIINTRDGEVRSNLQTRCEQKCTSTYVP